MSWSRRFDEPIILPILERQQLEDRHDHAGVEAVLRSDH
jgi:hypothetical protein